MKGWGGEGERRGEEGKGGGGEAEGEGEEEKGGNGRVEKKGGEGGILQRILFCLCKSQVENQIFNMYSYYAINRPDI